MSDLDTLIVTFQTQLSDVMEAVVKTAMFEVTRLVEDVLLVEVKRGKQEAESLRLQLQRTEGKFSDGGTTRRCVDCARIDSDQSKTTEGRPSSLQDGTLRRCDVENPGDSVECWMPNHQESKVASPDNPPVTQSPEREPQTTEEEELMANMDMKEEVQNLSCSSLHLRSWSSTLDGEDAFESENVSEIVEAQPKPAQGNAEELLKNPIKKDPQTSTACEFPDDQTEMHMATDRPNVSAFELDSSWADLPAAATGLLQNHRLGSEKECDPVKTKGSVKQSEHVRLDSVRADIQFNSNKDQLSSTESPHDRLQPRNTLTIKKEVVVDSGGCQESGHAGEKTQKAGTLSFTCSVQQHRVNSEAQKTNIYHKTTMQEIMKLHSNKGTGLRLQAAMQHLHRPLKKPPHTLPSSPTAALSTAHSQVVNVNNLNRISSTNKTVAAPPLSVQRLHLGGKQTSSLNRTGASSWVNIKSHHQPANCDEHNPVPHPISQLYTGSRQLLRCGQCGKCFPHPSNLKAHLQTHTGERPFCCSLCGRSFTKLSNLKAHRRVHTGERPYCCVACGKRFTQKCNLKRHQRIHLDM
ncbi:zinc finger protein 37 [Kryptolebias marmoratus]|uniref:C2H2-type domain-containing protein n=1 Tax=Kryptolebias marmoratus TaxID=37003 RepID=A0A3Q2ZCI9_KRYMA|nr:zinc finger protein 37 [Kryptolebias marmoratus]